VDCLSSGLTPEAQLFPGVYVNALMTIIITFEFSGDGEKPISFFNKKLSRCQVAWSVVEREALAAIASLRKFHQLIFGSMVVAYSDRNPLCFLVEGCSHSAKFTKWNLSLQKIIDSDVSIYKSDFSFDYFHVTKFYFDFDFFRYSYALLINVVVFT
jgi:hypothetical protein